MGPCVRVCVRALACVRACVCVGAGRKVWVYACVCMRKNWREGGLEVGWVGRLVGVWVGGKLGGWMDG